MLVKLSVAVADAAVCGLNVTLKEVLWPAGMVIGKVNPLTLKAELFVLAALTVTFAPVAVRVPEAVPLVPTTTFPTASVLGLTANWPAAAVPVPDNGILSVGFEPFEVMLTLPLTAPAAVGANETLKPALCPAPNVTGAVIPLKPNPLPVTPI